MFRADDNDCTAKARQVVKSRTDPIEKVRMAMIAARICFFHVCSFCLLFVFYCISYFYELVTVL